MGECFSRDGGASFEARPSAGRLRRAGVGWTILIPGLPRARPRRRCASFEARPSAEPQGCREKWVWRLSDAQNKPAESTATPAVRQRRHPEVLAARAASLEGRATLRAVARRGVGTIAVAGPTRRG